jgi:hypothetical protein
MRTCKLLQNVVEVIRTGSIEKLKLLASQSRAEVSVSYVSQLPLCDFIIVVLSNKAVDILFECPHGAAKSAESLSVRLHPQREAAKPLICLSCVALFCLLLRILCRRAESVNT